MRPFLLPVGRHPGFKSPEAARSNTLRAMARRGWGRSIATAFLTAAGLAAAQLGLAYGLGIIAWSVPDDATMPDGAWSAALVWATWIAANSSVVGAVCGERLGGGGGGAWFARACGRLAVALAATLGALVTIPLVALPARTAQVSDNFAPYLLAGVYCAIGAVAGLLLALLALAARAVAANVIASESWLWVLAVIALADDAAAGRSSAYVQLGVWKYTDRGPLWHGYYVPGLLLMFGSALLIGGLAAFPSAGRGANRLGVAVSGVAGPALVAVAYLAAGPSPQGAPFEQVSAFAAAPYAVVAGLVGSALVAAIGGVPAPRPPRSPAEPDSARTATARPEYHGSSGYWRDSG